jgi:hypothetical protein
VLQNVTSSYISKIDNTRSKCPSYERIKSEHYGNTRANKARGSIFDPSCCCPTSTDAERSICAHEVIGMGSETTPTEKTGTQSPTPTPQAASFRATGLIPIPESHGEIIQPNGDVLGWSTRSGPVVSPTTPSAPIPTPKTQSTSPESIAAANLAAERNAAYRSGVDMNAWDAAHAAAVTPTALTPEQDAAQEEAKHQAAFHGGGVSVDVSTLANTSLSNIESMYGSAIAEKTQEYFRAHPTQRFQDITNLAEQQRYNIIGSSGLQQYMGQTADKRFTGYTEAGELNYSNQKTNPILLLQPDDLHFHCIRHSRCRFPDIPKIMLNR